MNPDAGTEDFFWREMNQEEEEAAKRALLEQHKRDIEWFFEKLRLEEQKRAARRERKP